MSVPLSKACCDGVPAVNLEANPDGYVNKGVYETVNSLKTYVTGPDPSTATKAIVYIYDIFGYQPQTLRGADVLATNTDATVFMPDLFGDDALPTNPPPTITPEQRAAILGAFFQSAGELGKNKQLAYEIALHIKKTYPNITKVACFGLCWGGKIALCAGNIPLEGEKGKSVFVATAQGHPTKLLPEDGEGLTVPHLIIPTKDEDPAAIAAYEAVSRPEGCETVWYKDMIHGFMGAKASLNNPDVMEKFHEAYAVVGKFFSKYLS